MSVRYYWISFLVVLVLTVLITWVKQTRTRKEFFMIMLKVTLGLVGVGFGLVGLSKLLVALGISKAGFIF
ncbi:MAG: hypothetical protein IIA63_12265 [Nitrospinae bacterium]|nr:hypothetical protein [Nitrospinota bacterium]MCH7651916.1 hypothetical protein [Nitrospinota bacterium]MCH8932184.1 hypothetical protein [Nitrospinota bacterium]TDJ50608.1 MAG: hypothetical protein E2O43_08165 [Nitrospina sp.]